MEEEERPQGGLVVKGGFLASARKITKTQFI